MWCVMVHSSSILEHDISSYGGFSNNHLHPQQLVIMVKFLLQVIKQLTCSFSASLLQLEL